MRVERISNEKFRADGLILSFTITRTRGCISLSLWTHIFRFFEEPRRFQRRTTIRWFDESERLLKKNSWKEITLWRRDLFRYIAIILLLQRTHHLEDQYLSRFAELDLLGLAVITSFDFWTLPRISSPGEIGLAVLPLLSEQILFEAAQTRSWSRGGRVVQALRLEGRGWWIKMKKE